MRRRERAPVEPLSAGGPLALKAPAIEGRLPDLFNAGLACGCGDDPDRIFDQIVDAFLRFRAPRLLGDVGCHDGDPGEPRSLAARARAGEPRRTGHEEAYTQCCSYPLAVSHHAPPPQMLPGP